MLNFTAIDHPSLSIPWLLRSLEEVFAASEGRLDTVSFGIDGSRGIEDKRAMFEGYVYFEPSNGNGLSEDVKASLAGQGHRFGLTEDEKDHIPAVRRMERLTENLRFHLPIPFDSDGVCQGDWQLIARPGMLRFVFDSRGWEPDGAQIHICATNDGASWSLVTEIRFDVDDPDSITLRVPQDELEARFDPGYFRVKMPQAKSVTVGDEIPDMGDALIAALRSHKKQIVIGVQDDAFEDICNDQDDRDDDAY